MTKSPWGKDRIRGAAVAFEELSYTYAGGVNALQSVSIRVAASDFTAIMGANGSGNSTLMKLAIGLLHPSQGEVHIDDLIITPEQFSQVVAPVGHLFQDPNDQLFCPTVGAGTRARAETGAQTRDARGEPRDRPHDGR
jgi:energy-coupling factor transporter ATP-binding protein EcfA2